MTWWCKEEKKTRGSEKGGEGKRRETTKSVLEFFVCGKVDRNIWCCVLQ